MADVSLIVPTKDGEVRVSLHPISLALVLVEVVETRARRRCWRKGHVSAGDMYDHCARCGTSLPDPDGDRRSWHPSIYRSWGPRPDRASS